MHLTQAKYNRLIIILILILALLPFFFMAMHTSRENSYIRWDMVQHLPG